MGGGGGGDYLQKDVHVFFKHKTPLNNTCTSMFTSEHIFRQ